MVARQQVVANSYLWPDGTVPYQQWGTASPTGDRPDCSGYVGGCCWGIPVPVNTVSLVTDGWMYEIPVDQLQPGDALGLCGPGTAGNAGHIQLFEGWTETGLAIAEQSGGPPGPRHRTIKRIAAGYKAYRFKGIADAPTTPPEEDDMAAYVIARDNHTGQLYLANGMVSRPITDADVVNIHTLAGEGLFTLTNGGATRDGWGPGAFGPVAAGGGVVDLEPVTKAAYDGAKAGSLTEQQVEDASFRGAQRAESQ